MTQRWLMFSSRWATSFIIGKGSLQRASVRCRNHFFNRNNTWLLRAGVLARNNTSSSLRPYDQKDNPFFRKSNWKSSLWAAETAFCWALLVKGCITTVLRTLSLSGIHRNSQGSCRLRWMGWKVVGICSGTPSCCGETHDEGEGEGAFQWARAKGSILLFPCKPSSLFHSASFCFLEQK